MSNEPDADGQEEPKRQARCIEVNVRDKDVQYTYTLTPSFEHEGQALDTIALVVAWTGTCVYRADDNKRLLCMDRFGGGVVLPEEFLWAWGNYVEPMASVLYRHWIAQYETLPVLSPLPVDLRSRIPRALQEWWEKLDDAQRLVAGIMAKEAHRREQEQTQEHERALRMATAQTYEEQMNASDDEDAEVITRGVRAFLRAIRRSRASWTPDDRDGDIEDYDD